MSSLLFMKTKIIILKEVRLDGEDKYPGEEAELENSILSTWLELGYCKIPDPDMPPPESTEESTKEETEEEKDLESKLKPCGIGYYELPDGSKVKGKAAALEALKILEAKEGGGENGT